MTSYLLLNLANLLVRGIVSEIKQVGFLKILQMRFLDRVLGGPPTNQSEASYETIKDLLKMDGLMESNLNGPFKSF